AGAKEAHRALRAPVLHLHGAELRTAARGDPGLGVQPGPAGDVPPGGLAVRRLGMAVRQDHTERLRSEWSAPSACRTVTGSGRACSAPAECTTNRRVPRGSPASRSPAPSHGG